MRNKKKNNNVSIVTTPSVFNVYLGADNRQLNGAGFFLAQFLPPPKFPLPSI